MTFLPIVERELRLRARQLLTHRVRLSVAVGVLLLFLLLQAFASEWPSHRVGQIYFGFLGVLTLGYCLLAGTFLTADCLSSEKREGTLGLLFLTDLRGFDVVLGKLVATSLQASYALLAMVPAMALPLLMGGVAFEQFWRLVLVLALVLLSSLSMGMLTSALSRESRQSMLVSAGLVLGLAVGPYLAWLGLNYIPWFSPHSGLGEWFLLLSPVHAYVQAFEASSWSPASTSRYWHCVQALLVLGVAPLILSSILLPRLGWDGRADYGTHDRVSWRRFLGWIRWGGRHRKQGLKSLLELNPMQWLDARDRLPALIQTVVMGGLVSIWLVSFVILLHQGARGTFQAAFPVTVLLAFGIHQVFKVLIAIEAAKRLSDDRGSGALELVLVTPLACETILQGLVQSMKARFWWPLAMVTLMNLVLHWLIAWDAPLRMDGDGHFMMGWVMCLGGIATMFVDFSALTWQGMLQGLRRKHHRAVLVTLARIMIPSWALIGLFALWASSSRLDGEMIYVLIVLWFALGFVSSRVALVQARDLLQRHFRSLGAGDKPPDDAPSWHQTLLVEPYGQETHTGRRP